MIYTHQPLKKKTMKTNIKYLAIAAVALFASCNKQLDITPEGSPSAQNFWKTEQDAIKAEAGMYEKYNEEDYYGRGMFWFINASDDMVTGRNKPEADNIKTSTAITSVVVIQNPNGACVMRL
jgi:hypothetical protein